ncbi:hypothetical protein ColKHC_12955 [Colletotrichum higginsianum]|nr:hypothetical protein ColKHC_12955 [Colletotrichum higginsianum]
MRLTSESKGSSAISLHSGSSSPSSPVVSRSRFQSKREANTWIAISVGSPRAAHWPSSFLVMVARLARAATRRNAASTAGLSRSSWPASTTLPHASPPLLKLRCRGDRSSKRISPVVGSIGDVAPSTPGAAGEHLALRQRARLVGADVGDGAEGLERLEVAHDDVAAHHALRAGGHGDGQHDDEAGRDHGQARGDGVDDDLLRGLEPVGAQHDDGADDGDAEQQHRQLGELLLQRRADVDAQEAPDGVGEGERVGLEVAVRLRPAVGLALDLAHAGVLLAQRRRDGADLGVDARREDDALGPALGHRRRAVGHVEPVARARGVREHAALVLAHGEGFARQQRLVRLEVDGLGESVDRGCLRQSAVGCSCLVITHNKGDKNKNEQEAGDRHSDRDRDGDRAGPYLTSAGMVSPVLISTRSPGTMSPDGTTMVSPSRTMLAVGELRDRSESIVFSAENSWKKPTTTLRRMTKVMTPPSIHDPMPKLTAMARMRTCGVVVCVDERKSVSTHHGHGVGDLGDNDLEGLHALRLAEVIVAVLLQARLGVGGREPVVGVGAEFLGQLLERQGVGGLGEWFVRLARDVRLGGPRCLGFSHCGVVEGESSVEDG